MISWRWCAVKCKLRIQISVPIFQSRRGVSVLGLYENIILTLYFFFFSQYNLTISSSFRRWRSAVFSWLQWRALQTSWATGWPILHLLLLYMPSEMATKPSIMLHCTFANLSEINANEQSCGEQMFFNTSFNMRGLF